MTSIEAMYSRRSIRKYKDKPVEKEKIDTLLKCAMAAPSAHNSQPWHFVVLDEKEKMKKIHNFFKYGKYNAPAAIVVCANMDNHHKKTVEDFWVQDCTAALMNILNAAVELSLGTVWLGTYPIKKLMEFTSYLLELPKNIIPLGVVYVGYPDEQKEARTQYDTNKITFF